MDIRTRNQQKLATATLPHAAARFKDRNVESHTVDVVGKKGPDSYRQIIQPGGISLAGDSNDLNSAIQPGQMMQVNTSSEGTKENSQIGAGSAVCSQDKPMRANDIMQIEEERTANETS